MARSKKLSRRRLLQGAGALAASLPFLRQATTAEAAGEGKKLLVVFSPNSVLHSSIWTPDTSGAFNMAPVFEDLRPYNDNILFMDGLHIGPAEADQKGGHNAMGMLLTGHPLVYPNPSVSHVFRGGGASIDYVVGDFLGEAPLNLGIRTERDYGTYLATYSARDTAAMPIQDPSRSFTRAFGDGGGMGDQAALDLAAQRSSVLNYAAGELTSLQGRLPTADRRKLEMHLDEINALEARLNRPAVSCDSAMPPLGYDPLASANVPRTIRDQVDIAVQALRCGVNRVATIQMGASAGCGTPGDWDEIDVNNSDGEHDIIHAWRQQESGSELHNSMEVSKFYSKMTRYILDQLGDDLDDTIVLWVKHIGYNHGTSNVPMMLIGGNADGCYQSGRHIRFDDISHQNVLASVCNMMGMDVTSFGDPASCTGVADLS